MSVGDLVANLSLNTAGFTSPLAASAAALSGTVRSMSSSLGSLATSGSKSLGNLSKGVGEGIGKSLAGLGKGIANASRVASNIGSGVGSAFSGLGKGASAFAVGIAKANTESAKAAAIQAKLAASMAKTASNTSLATQSFASFIGNLASNAFSRVVSGLKNIGVSSVSMAAQLEQSQVAFTTLLGSSEAAATHLGQLRDFAAKTPFQFTDLIQASRRMMALGFEAGQVIPVLRVVGDAAGALGIGAEGVDRITLALGQMKSKGSAQAQEFNQLAEAGIPAWNMLAKVLGTDVQTAMKMVENRAVDADTAVKAILEGMQGKFAGGMASQAKTLAGQFSNLKDNAEFALTEIGQALIDGFDFKGLLANASDFAASFRDDWLPSIKSGINTVSTAFTSLGNSVNAVFQRLFGMSAVESATTFFKNFGLFVDIGIAEFNRLDSNVSEVVSTMFTNAGEWMSWLGDNWVDVLKDIVNANITAWSNIGKDIAHAVQEVWDFIASGGKNKIEMAFTPIGEGFVSSIKDLPQLTQAELQATTPELVRLYEELARRQQEALRPKPGAAVTPEEKLQLKGGKLSPATGGGSGSREKEAGFAEKGSKDALSSIISNVNSSRNPQQEQLNVAKQQLEEQKKTTAAVEKNSSGGVTIKSVSFA